MLYVKLPNGGWISRDLIPRESTVSPKQTIINSNPTHALQHDETGKYKHLWLFPSEHLVVIWRHAMIWANGMLRTLNCCNLLNWWGRKWLCFLLHLEKLFIISSDVYLLGVVFWTSAGWHKLSPKNSSDWNGLAENLFFFYCETHSLWYKTCLSACKMKISGRNGMAMFKEDERCIVS